MSMSDNVLSTSVLCPDADNSFSAVCLLGIFRANKKVTEMWRFFPWLVYTVTVSTSFCTVPSSPGGVDSYTVLVVVVVTVR